MVEALLILDPTFVTRKLLNVTESTSSLFYSTSLSVHPRASTTQFLFFFFSTQF